MRRLLFCISIATATYFAFWTWDHRSKLNFPVSVDRIVSRDVPKPKPFIPPVEVAKGPYKISHVAPDKWLTYPEVVDRLKEWNKEAPEITKFGTYGKTKGGTDCTYLRIGTEGKPKVLIHGCIHGNERLATGSVLYGMGKILSEYKKNDDITWIVDNRDIWFVAFSPDTYLKSREIEGADPNRKWETNQASPIMRMKELFEQNKFVGAIDCHTFGQIVMQPDNVSSADRDAVKKFNTDMASAANYGPTTLGSGGGYAVSWYYQHYKTMAMLIEHGRGTHEQPVGAIAVEGARVFPAYYYMIKNAPEVHLAGVGASYAYPAYRNILPED